MKPATAALFLLAFSSGAAANSGWPHRDPARPFNLRMAQLPQTDADVDRATRRALRPRNFVDDIANELNLRDGKADIFDERQIGASGNGELSGSIDAHGATLRLRW
jgi:hypothetical protein